MEEFEVVYTDINIEDFEKKLENIGAQKVDDIFYKIDVFDYPDYSLNSKGAWIRLRDDGKKVKLAYKERLGRGEGKNSNEDLGMKEVEFAVNDFEKAKEFMLSIGFIEKHYQEKKRIRWKKGDVTFDIDIYPKLNPYVEIESDSFEKVDEAILELGLDINKKRIINNWEIYKENGIDILKYKKVAFDELVLKDNLIKDKN